MELEELETESALLYRMARSDVRAPPGVLALARRLGFTIAWGGTHGLPAFYDRELHRICVRQRMGLVATTFWIAHELGEFWLTRMRIDSEHREKLCDALAVRIIAPWEAFWHAVAVHGRDVPALAETFHLSQTCAALRLGEVSGFPVAVVMPGRVLARGSVFEWGDEKQVRALARAGELPRGVRRMRLTDQPRRVALMGE